MSIKKPSKPIVVGDKRYYKYLIIWEDIVGDQRLQITMKLIICIVL